MGYSPVHIKIHQNEAIDIKKGMLSSEMDLLKLIRIIRKYKIMRLQEIKIKDGDVLAVQLLWGDFDFAGRVHYLLFK